MQCVKLTTNKLTDVMQMVTCLRKNGTQEIENNNW